MQKYQFLSHTLMTPKKSTLKFPEVEKNPVVTAQSDAASDSVDGYLHAAAEAAKRALQRAKPECSAFLAVMRRYDAEVKAASISLESSAASSIRDAINAYQLHYDNLRQKLDGLVQEASSTLQSALEDLEKEANFVTIMLFGRTRAGKSTTMEALTGGDGSTIGVGRQHTTTDIRTYYFPRLTEGVIPERPLLRIVDTPGIEGFEGQALGAMAEKFVERSDHILFLLSDDKASSDELDRFGLIKTQGKGVTVLLNVKAADDNLDLLVTHPAFIFKDDQIEGHSRRISGYLEREFDIPPPRLIPLHARAAWIGRRQEDLPENVSDRETLVRNSRLPDLEARITEFIREDAVPARLCAPSDLLLGYLYPLKDELLPFAHQFHRMNREILELAHKLEEGAGRARRRSAKRLPLLRARFQSASDAIPGMVDSIIQEGARGAALKIRRRMLLEEHGVSDAAEWFSTAAMQDFESEIAEQIRVDAFDHEFAKREDFDDLLGGYHEAEKSANKQKYARAAIRTAGGVGAGAMATWAVANWWNPTGWVAAVGALVVVGSGMLGSEAARAVTEKLERSSRKEMMDKRSEIVIKLCEQIWFDFSDVKKGCEDWLDRTQSAYVELANGVVRTISTSAQELAEATQNCLRQVDEIGTRVNASLVTDLFHALIPECASGSVRVQAVARVPGYRTKVIIASEPPGRLNAKAVCIGKQGQRINQIRRALGGEIVDLVDGTVSREAQALQALGLIRGEPPRIVLHADSRSVRIRFATASQVSAAIGRDGSNVRMAKKLCNLNILIEEKVK
jgi:transcription antitermination factor NusA-like protein/GTP-binding protein EngB required for normal cell division